MVSFLLNLREEKKDREYRDCEEMGLGTLVARSPPLLCCALLCCLPESTKLVSSLLLLREET